jgi:hypothetical protein
MRPNHSAAPTALPRLSKTVFPPEDHADTRPSHPCNAALIRGAHTDSDARTCCPSSRCHHSGRSIRSASSLPPSAISLLPTVPNAGCSYVLACRRQLPEVDSLQTLAEYRKLADEAEALAAVVAPRRQAARLRGAARAPARSPASGNRLSGPMTGVSASPQPLSTGERPGRSRARPSTDHVRGFAVMPRAAPSRIPSGYEEPPGSERAAASDARCELARCSSDRGRDEEPPGWIAPEARALEGATER